MVTIIWQISYYSSILCQDYGIIQGLPMNHMRFADWVTIWVVHLPEWTETGMAKLPPCIAAIAVTFLLIFILSSIRIAS